VGEKIENFDVNTFVSPINGKFWAPNNFIDFKNQIGMADPQFDLSAPS
jgi:hypothetical protein